MPRKKQKKRQGQPKTEEAFVECILEEREGPSSKGRKRRKHEYLCAWTDGANPQWVDAAKLEGSPALEEWQDKEDEQPELFDKPEEAAEKARTLAEWIQAAHRPVFLLGAGVSASVLPTFRGKNGLWTKNAHKNKLADAKVSSGIQPTRAHRALVALEQAGHVYFVATQNYDDLSVRSGFPEHKLSELHGNIFTETCDKCHTKYRRNFEVPLDSAKNHETGRTCDECGGILRDSIIHFDEHLPWDALKMANAKFVGADLTIVLGSSLRVEPAASYPFKAKNRSRASNKPKASIVNLQPTRMDDQADLIIRETCDKVIDFVAKMLLGDGWDSHQSAEQRTSSTRETAKQKSTTSQRS